MFLCINVLQEKLEKQVEKLKEDVVHYDRFINRMHQWLLDNADTAVEMFRHIDSDGEGLLSFDEFKSGDHHHIYFSSIDVQ